jgi:hypothetical protein
MNLFAYASANPIRLVDRTGLADETADVAKQIDAIRDRLKLKSNQGDAALAQSEPTKEAFPEERFKDFVLQTLPDEPTPTTAREKSEYVDIVSAAHDEAVVKIINAAIDAAAEKARMRGDVLSEYELLRSALHGIVVPYRNTSASTSQNLVMRDVDHYLTGRIQEWRKEIGFLPFTTEGDPQYVKSPGTIAEEKMWPMEPGPPLIKTTIVGWGEDAAAYYENDKLASFRANPNPDAPNAKSSQDLSSLPASAPGARFWAWMGGQHLLTRDDPRQKADPAKLKITIEEVQAARQERKRLDEQALKDFERREREEMTHPGRF